MTQTRDIRQHVTDTIIAEIEKGTPPWRQPWTGGKVGAALPVRHNGEPYRGVNVLMLWATAHTQRLQLRPMDDLPPGQGSLVAASARARPAPNLSTSAPSSGTVRQTGRARSTASPTSKLTSFLTPIRSTACPEEFYIRPDPPRDLGTKPDPALDAWFAATGADILSTDEPAAYYRPSTDQIHMPPIATFLSAAQFYGVQSHELTHWSGASRRIDRIKRFQDKTAYAFEELVAEIGASMLSLQLGVEPRFDQSAAYIETWLAALKGDKTLIFKAAAEAQKAVDYITGLVDARTQNEVAA